MILKITAILISVEKTSQCVNRIFPMKVKEPLFFVNNERSFLDDEKIEEHQPEPYLSQEALDKIRENFW